MSLVLIGDINSLRSQYFMKAANELCLDVVFASLADIKGGAFPLDSLKNAVVKLDPPEYNSCSLSELNQLVSEYIDTIDMISNIEGIKFINEPAAIKSTLNKLTCKKILTEAGVDVTPFLTDKPLADFNLLIELMKNKHIYSVFIKPVFGSGAAGVSAFRVHPKSGKMCLYTSCQALNPNTGDVPQIYGLQLINTSKIRKYEEPDEIKNIIGALLGYNSVIEQWMPKANHNNISYDLRSVIQFGKLRHIVARQSKTPITNLHLNNNALEYYKLGLDDSKLYEIECLCQKAVACFSKERTRTSTPVPPNSSNPSQATVPAYTWAAAQMPKNNVPPAGLNIAGIDVLLSKDTLKPYIIEINAQGDLIYNDIFQENLIYKEQIREMEKLNEI